MYQIIVVRVVVFRAADRDQPGDAPRMLLEVLSPKPFRVRVLGCTNDHSFYYRSARLKKDARSIVCVLSAAP